MAVAHSEGRWRNRNPENALRPFKIAHRQFVPARPVPPTTREPIKKEEAMSAPTEVDKEGHSAIAQRMLEEVIRDHRSGSHGMLSVQEYDDNMLVSKDVEYTILTASFGALNMLMGDRRGAEIFLDMILANVPRDRNRQFTLGPERNDPNTMSALWTSILAHMLGDSKVSAEQGFIAAIHDRHPSGKERTPGLYVRSPGSMPSTYMNALIGVSHAQKNKTDLARAQLFFIDRDIPLCRDGLHYHTIPTKRLEADKRAVTEVALAVSMLKIQVEGAAKAEDYCIRASRLGCNSIQSKILSGIMHAMLSGRTL